MDERRAEEVNMNCFGLVEEWEKSGMNGSRSSWQGLIFMLG
jgi:hypothetical protein